MSDAEVGSVMSCQDDDAQIALDWIAKGEQEWIASLDCELELGVAVSQCTTKAFDVLRITAQVPGVPLDIAESWFACPDSIPLWNLFAKSLSVDGKRSASSRCEVSLLSSDGRYRSSAMNRKQLLCGGPKHKVVLWSREVDTAPESAVSIGQPELLPLTQCCFYFYPGGSGLLNMQAFIGAQRGVLVNGSGVFSSDLPLLFIQHLLRWPMCLSSPVANSGINARQLIWEYVHERAKASRFKDVMSEGYVKCSTCVDDGSACRLEGNVNISTCRLVNPIAMVTLRLSEWLNGVSVDMGKNVAPGLNTMDYLVDDRVHPKTMLDSVRIGMVRLNLGARTEVYIFKGILESLGDASISSSALMIEKGNQSTVVKFDIFLSGNKSVVTTTGPWEELGRAFHSGLERLKGFAYKKSQEELQACARKNGMNGVKENGSATVQEMLNILKAQQANIASIRNKIDERERELHSLRNAIKGRADNSIPEEACAKDNVSYVSAVVEDDNPRKKAKLSCTS